MYLEQLLSHITPEIYQDLQRAIEIGKWPDGQSVTDDQRELCMQAIIAYDQSQPAEQRTGYVPPKNTPCEPVVVKDEPLQWKDQ